MAKEENKYIHTLIQGMDDILDMLLTKQPQMGQPTKYAIILFTCLGVAYELDIYPNGHTDAAAKNYAIALRNYLRNNLLKKNEALSKQEHSIIYYATALGYGKLDLKKFIAVSQQIGENMQPIIDNMDTELSTLDPAKVEQRLYDFISTRADLFKKFMRVTIDGINTLSQQQKPNGFDLLEEKFQRYINQNKGPDNQSGGYQDGGDRGPGGGPRVPASPHSPKFTPLSGAQQIPNPQEEELVGTGTPGGGTMGAAMIARKTQLR